MSMELNKNSSKAMTPLITKITLIFFEHFLSKLLDTQKSTFDDVILRTKLFLNEVVKKCFLQKVGS